MNKPFEEKYPDGYDILGQSKIYSTGSEEFIYHQNKDTHWTLELSYLAVLHQFRGITSGLRMICFHCDFIATEVAYEASVGRTNYSAGGTGGS